MSKGARLRKAAGPTQEQLAERSGLSQQYISDLARGKRNHAHPEEDRACRGPSRRAVVTLYELAEVRGASHVELVRPD